MNIILAVRMGVIALGFALVAYLCTFLAKPRYAVSESLFFPMSASTSNPLFSRTASPTGDVNNFNGALSSPLIGGQIQTAVGLVESRSCAKFLVDTVGLDRHYRVSEPAAIGVVHQRLRTEIDKNGFLQVTFEDQSADVAVRVLQQVQTYLNRMSEQLSLNLSKKNREFVEARLARARRDLAKRENLLANRMSTSPSANPELLQKNLLDVRKEYAESLNKVSAAQAQIASSENSLRAVLAKAKDFPGRIMALNAISEHLTYLADELEKRRLALIDAANVYGPKDPVFLASIQNQANVDKIVGSLVKEQQGALKAGNTPALAEAKANLASLAATVTSYGDLLNEMSAEYSKAVQDSTRIAALHSDFSSAQQKVGQLEVEYELSLIAEERDPQRYQVVDPPDGPGEVVFPKRSMISFLVFALAIVAQLVISRGTTPRT